MILFFFIISMLLAFWAMLKMQEKGFVVISTIIGTVVLAFLFTGSSIFWTKDIAYNTETLKHLEFGWPIHFVIQNHEIFEPPFPHVRHVSWSLSSNTPDYPANHFIKKNFYSSLTVNFLGILFIWLLIIFYLKRIER